MDSDQVTAALRHDRYTRSNAYEGRWVVDNLMGPNVLWLTEALTQVQQIEQGMRVLDLGCGKAVSSIFLAREFGAAVWAADLWIAPTENLERSEAAGVADRVFPIRAEAHALPFAEAYFDAIVSMDAYHYFGTDDLYLAYLSRFLKRGGSIGIVVPGVREEMESVPAELADTWEPDYWTFHSPAWWQRHWERSGAVNVRVADWLPGGKDDWLRWSDVCRRAGASGPGADDSALLMADVNHRIGFTRVAAERL